MRGSCFPLATGGGAAFWACLGLTVCCGSARVELSPHGEPARCAGLPVPSTRPFCSSSSLPLLKVLAGAARLLWSLTSFPPDTPAAGAVPV